MERGLEREKWGSYNNAKTMILTRKQAYIGEGKVGELKGGGVWMLDMAP